MLVVVPKGGGLWTHTGTVSETSNIKPNQPSRSVETMETSHRSLHIKERNIETTIGMVAPSNQSIETHLAFLLWPTHWHSLQIQQNRLHSAHQRTCWTQFQWISSHRAIASHSSSNQCSSNRQMLAQRRTLLMPIPHPHTTTNQNLEIQAQNPVTMGEISSLWTQSPQHNQAHWDADHRPSSLHHGWFSTWQSFLWMGHCSSRQNQIGNLLWPNPRLQTKLLPGRRLWSTVSIEIPDSVHSTPSNRNNRCPPGLLWQWKHRGQCQQSLIFHWTLCKCNSEGRLGCHQWNCGEQAWIDTPSFSDLDQKPPRWPHALWTIVSSCTAQRWCRQSCWILHDPPLWPTLKSCSASPQRMHPAFARRNHHQQTQKRNSQSQKGSSTACIPEPETSMDSHHSFLGGLGIAWTCSEKHQWQPHLSEIHPQHASSWSHLEQTWCLDLFWNLLQLQRHQRNCGNNHPHA